MVGAARSATSISTPRSSSPPARRTPRIFSRVVSREPGKIKQGIFLCVTLCGGCLGTIFLCYQLAGTPPRVLGTARPAMAQMG